MITKPQKEKLRVYLKKDWVPEVMETLSAQNIRTSKGKLYSESMIRMVFTGKIEHLAIEKAIFNVFKSRKESHEAYEREKEALLSCNEKKGT
jgi:hypothetical protein